MKKVELHVPNKSYDGIFGGVKFSKGVGIFTDAEKAKRLAKRYSFEIVEEKEVEVKVSTEVETKVETEVKPKPKRTRKKAEPKAGE